MYSNWGIWEKNFTSGLDEANKPRGREGVEYITWNGPN